MALQHWHPLIASQHGSVQHACSIQAAAVPSDSTAGSTCFPVCEREQRIVNSDIKHNPDARIKVCLARCAFRIDA